MGYYIEECNLNMIHTEVMKFIKDFKVLHPKEIEEVFTSGYCYWFAFILKERFKYANPQLMYNDIDGHFACKIHNMLYDIRGTISKFSSENYKYWEEYRTKEPYMAERIKKDCILKNSYDDN